MSNSSIMLYYVPHLASSITYAKFGTQNNRALEKTFCA